MREPYLFSQVSPFLHEYKKNLSSVILIAPLLSSLLLARVPQMVFIFPGSRPVHLVFSLQFCVVVGHASDLFGSPMVLSFSSNQRVLLFSSPPFFPAHFQILLPPFSTLSSLLENSSLVSSLLSLIFVFVNGREIRPLHEF